MTSPTILLVPGVFEGPGSWDRVKTRLEKLGLQVHVIALKTTGTEAHEGFGFREDIAHIRNQLEPLVRSQGREVIVVAHSAGGFLAAHATKGLDKKTRSAHGFPGGVIRFVFIAAALIPAGQSHPKPIMPFCDVQGQKVLCKDPRHTFFNDLPDEEAQDEIGKLAFEPSEGWEMAVEYAGWEEVPSAYLTCEKDATVPMSMQQSMSSLANCDPIEIVDAGHCAQISQPDAVVKFITKFTQL